MLHNFKKIRDGVEALPLDSVECDTILLLMDGKSCPEIAQWLYRDEETIRIWVHAFNEAGLPGLERAPIPGRPA
jgi:transposase